MDETSSPLTETVPNASITPVDDAAPREHSLSQMVAQSHGHNAAALLKYFDFVIHRHGTTKDGRKWYRINLDHLTEKFPYLSRTCIADTLNQLTAPDNGPLLVHRDNYHGYDRTGNYAFKHSTIAGQSRTHLRYFSPQDATEHGLPAALILHNLRHWDSKKDDSSDGWIAVKTEELGKQLALTAKQVKFALGSLTKAGVLERVAPSGKHRTYRYRLVNRPAIGVQIPDMERTNTDMEGTIPDMKSPNPDNNISYQIKLAVPCEQKKSYSVRPAGPVAVSESNTLSETKSIIAAINPYHEAVGLDAPVQDEVKSNDSTSRSQGPDSTLTPSVPSTSAATSLKPQNPAIRKTIDSHFTPPQIDSCVPKADKSIFPTKWPARFSDLLALVRQLQAKLDPVTRERFELLYSTKLAKWVAEQPLDILEQWMQLKDSESIYAQLQTVVDDLPFKEVSNADTYVMACIRRIFMSRFVEMLTHFDFQYNRFCGVPYPYRHYLEIIRRLQPRVEASRKAAQEKWLQEKGDLLEARKQQFRSPDAESEKDQTLPSTVKVKVLKNGILSLNQSGWFDQKYEITNNLIAANDNSYRLAKKLFEDNPGLTPNDLLELLSQCAGYVALEPKPEGYDPKYILRKGTHLSSLLKGLPEIVTALGADWFPATNIHTEDVK